MTETVANSAEDKQQLYDILTSEDYSKAKEIKLPKQDEDTISWIERFIDWWSSLGSNGSSNPIDSFYIFSAVLKGLAVLALILLVYWIIKNSDSIIGWVKSRSWKVGNRIVAIEDYRQAHLAQGWESLPPHAQIPPIVQQLLNEGNILPASSILYRGSLRWLNEVNPQTTIIRPANTELQCVELIKQLRQSHTGISASTADYIIDIINQWIPIAYKTNDTDSDTDTNKQQYEQEQAQYKQSLLSVVNDWQRQLTHDFYTTQTPPNGEAFTLRQKLSQREQKK